MSTLKNNALANAFAVIAADSQAIESKADGVLSIVRMTGIKDEKQFSEAVKAAYLENGWNATRGKPVTGSKAEPVPVTVKQYVSGIRAAFRLGLNVGKAASFTALRKQIKTARAAKRTVEKPEDARVMGLRLVQPSVLTGAPFHDLLVTYHQLDAKRQGLLVGSVGRLLRDYKVDVPLLKAA